MGQNQNSYKYEGNMFYYILDDDENIQHKLGGRWEDLYMSKGNVGGCPT